MSLSEKCPACGWRVDQDAYRCTKCFIYFCYKCRKRIQSNQEQFQCVNQNCSAHGKLTCSACTVMVPEFRDYNEKIRHAGKSGFGVILCWLCVTLFGILTFIIGPFIAILVGIFAFVIGAILFIVFKIPFFDQPETFSTVTNNKKFTDHRCCIKCRSPLQWL